MAKIAEILFRRYGFIRSLKAVVALSLITVGGCKTVPINLNDYSPPNVTIKVNGPNGFQEQTSVNYSNSTAQQPIEIMCIVKDPEGVKSIDLRVSDTTVDAAYCSGGGVYSPGNYTVDGLPSPKADTLSGSSGKVPTSLFSIIEISGILKLGTKPPGVTKTCYPANNTKVIVRCRGGNWSSNQGSSTSTKYLDVKF